MGLQLFFLLQCLTRGMKGQNSSTRHPGRDNINKSVWKLRKRWTDRTKQTGRLKQTGRHKKKTNDSDSEREGEEGETNTRTDGGMDCMQWTQLSLPPIFPASASCHSQEMTAPILSLSPSPQSHKDLILSSQSERHIKLVHCYVCV